MERGFARGSGDEGELEDMAEEEESLEMGYGTPSISTRSEA
jgi:hypothetical protein